MKWVKAPEELKVLVQEIMQPVDCEKKPMFGYPAFFINRNMFSGLFQDKLFLRLSPQQIETLSKQFPEIRNLEPMPGRPMKDYFVIPERLYRDQKLMPGVVQAAATHCRGLPAKSPRPRKPTEKKKPRPRG